MAIVALMVLGGFPVPAEGPGSDGGSEGCELHSLDGDRSNRTYQLAEAKAVRQVLTTDLSTRVWDLDWSPNSDHLAVCAGTGGGSGRFRLYSFNGTDLTTLEAFSHANDYMAVAWNPNGTCLALANSGYPGQNIKVYAFNGIALTEVASGLFQGANSVAWSPDGQYLAATGWYPDDNFGLFSYNGTALTLVDTYRVEDWGEDLAWSPDGRYLAIAWRYTDYYTPPHLSTGKVAILSFDGSTLTEKWTMDLGSSANTIDWSPDGDHIAIGYSGDYPNIGHIDAYRFSEGPTGSVGMDLRDTFEILSTVHSVSWASNGRYLLYGGYAGSDDCGILSFDGSDLSRVLYWAYGPAPWQTSWSHDGRHVAAGGTDGSRDLKIFELQYDALGTDDAFEVHEDTPEVLDVLGNDLTITGDIRVVNVSSVTHGSVGITPDGRDILYTPPANWSGKVDLNYRHSDMNGSDPSPMVEITVNPVNDVPVITTADVIMTKEDEEYSVQYDAMDGDANDTHEWSYSSEAAWLGFDPVTRVLSGTPTNDHVGIAKVTITVTDSNATRDVRSFYLTVENVNDAPEITTSDVVEVMEDSYYSIYYAASDIDPTNDVLAWSLETEATWLEMSSNHISGTPTNDDVGDHLVSVTVSDGNGGIDWTEFTITVVNTNDGPRILTTPSSAATEEEEYNQTLDAEDVDASDELSWSMKGPGWLSMDGAVLLGTPANDDVGTHGVTVSVTDGEAEDTLTFVIIVANVNDAPEWLSTPGDQALDAGDIMFIDALAEDEDGDRITYGLTSDPASSMTINPSTGTIRWFDAVPGEYTLDVTASDGVETIYHTLTITVAEPPVPPANKVPGISQFTVGNATSGEAFTLMLTGSDGDPWDGGNLTFTLVSGPSGMIVSADGAVLWLPSKDQLGTHPVVISLSDSKNSTTAEFDVVVTEAEKPDVEETGDDYMWLVIAMAVVVVVLVVLMMLMFMRQR